MSASSERVSLGLLFSILGGLLVVLSTVDDSAAFFMFLAIPISIFGSVMLTIGLIAKGVAIGVVEAHDAEQKAALLD